MTLALMHELCGHFTEGLANRKAPTTGQKIALSPVFIEGWAHYVERLLVDEGFLAGDVRLRLAVERSAILHAARLIAVVRLHAMGAKLDDVAAQLATEAGSTRGRRAARRSARRSIRSAMAETLGRVEIEKLRADYRAANPSASLGAFHDALLRHGSPPVTVLRRLLLPGDTSAL